MTQRDQLELEMSDCEYDDLYPVTEDDPSRRYVSCRPFVIHISLHPRLAYDENAATKWLDSRLCHTAGLPSSASTIIDQFLCFRLPQWVREKVTPSTDHLVLSSLLTRFRRRNPMQRNRANQLASRPHRSLYQMIYFVTSHFIPIMSSIVLHLIKPMTTIFIQLM